MRYHTRCRKCQTRRVLAHKPDWYVRQPKCKCCGARDYRIDRWMMRRDTRGMSCSCSGYWFIHRKGSFYCDHHPDGYANQAARGGCEYVREL